MASKPALQFSTLLASSVHDMKNTVGLMISQLESLQAQVGERAELDVLGLQVNQLNNSLMQLLAVYKLEQQLYPAPLEDFYLDEFCEDVLAAHQPLLEAMGLHLQADYPRDTSWTLDTGLLMAVVSTLFTNVMQLAQQQDAEVSELLLSVEPLTWDGMPYLRISVEDNGPGFADDRCGIFEPRQAAVEFTTGSSGLGLYFSYLVACHHQHEQHRGFLELGQSTALGGARVSLYLP